MQPPILVFEGWDLHLYDSVSDAELDLEAIDVEEGIYEAYDSQGRKLQVESEGQTVRIVEPGTGQTGVPDLRDLLIEFLTIEGKNPNPEERLESLIELCSPYRFKPPKSHWDVIKGLFRGGGQK